MNLEGESLTMNENDDMFRDQKNPFDEYDYSINQEAMDSPPKKSTSKPLIAGILLIIAGALGVLTWISALTFDISMLDPSVFQTQNISISPAQIQSMVQTCAVIGIILSVFPVLGGILSVQKKLWGGALACSILCLFTVGPLFLSSVLGLIALILIILSKDEFQRTKGNDSI